MIEVRWCGKCQKVDAAGVQCRHFEVKPLPGQSATPSDSAREPLSTTVLGQLPVKDSLSSHFDIQLCKVSTQFNGKANDLLIAIEISLCMQLDRFVVCKRSFVLEFSFRELQIYLAKYSATCLYPRSYSFLLLSSARLARAPIHPWNIGGPYVST